jgi:hypothetical protein
MRPRHVVTLALALYVALVACVAVRSDWRSVERHRWWAGLGPVLPHDTFPSDCKLCHEGAGWNTLVADFAFDHQAETGVPLHGAHEVAACLRCHNDRGPVDGFAARGCVGCHDDVHRGGLGHGCAECHDERSWRVTNGIDLHRRTRFPLTGVHASTSCRSCHQGAEVGVFSPTPVECVDCHQADLRAATTPDHFALGYVDRCDRCHVPFVWNRVELGN